MMTASEALMIVAIPTMFGIAAVMAIYIIIKNFFQETHVISPL